jgi:gamma-glutamyltranspeptidase/glutathione hydrolase
MVISQQGIAATSHPLASQAAARILERGGSAVDAAIAANAVLGLVEPMMDGIGGDLFVLYWDAKTGKLTGLNASGPAPRGLSPEFLAGKGIKAMPAQGIHTVTVPGAVQGWQSMHQKFGKLPWKDLFDAAIAYGDKGFPVTESIHEQWARAAGALHGDESTRVFLREGKAPAVGDVFRNPDLSKAYRLLAEEGPAAFYKGEVAKAILKTSQKMGGAMTATDLASFAPEFVEPVSIEYRGWRVYELPPNGQGMAALEMLNLMETQPAATAGPFSPAEMHLKIEAMKLAYADLRKYNADPKFSKVPVAGLLDKAYAKERARLINLHKANCDVSPGAPRSGDTTYLTIVDNEGNIASWIQSISALFGSGITVDGMGFILHNRGSGFVLDEGSPNRLAPGKRPFHTIIPGFMEKGDAHIGFGIMGGPIQPLEHALFVSNVIDYGMNVQQALEGPRILKTRATGCEVALEARVPPATVKGLDAMGHAVTVLREYTQETGRGQAILHDSRTGVNYAGSDPRADGAAVPALR